MIMIDVSSGDIDKRCDLRVNWSCRSRTIDVPIFFCDFFTSLQSQFDWKCPTFSKKNIHNFSVKRHFVKRNLETSKSLYNVFPRCTVKLCKFFFFPSNFWQIRLLFHWWMKLLFNVAETLTYVKLFHMGALCSSCFTLKHIHSREAQIWQKFYYFRQTPENLPKLSLAVN